MAEAAEKIEELEQMGSVAQSQLAGLEDLVEEKNGVKAELNILRVDHQKV